MKLFFAAEFTRNTGEVTLEGGEGGSADETIAKKIITSEDDDYKVVTILRKRNGATSWVAAQCDTNLSDATGRNRIEPLTTASAVARIGQVSVPRIKLPYPFALQVWPTTLYYFGKHMIYWTKYPAGASVG